MTFGEFIRLYEGKDRMIGIEVEGCEGWQTVCPRCREVMQGLNGLAVAGFWFEDDTLLVHLKGGAE